MNRLKNLGIGIITATILFSGCATTELQTSTRMAQSVFITPVKKELRTIFISSKNTSGQPIHLENVLVSDLQEKGYQIVDDPEEASYILMVNVLYCDKKQENNVGGGAVGAGAIGAGVAGYNHGGATGVVAAGLGAAVAGGLLGKALEDTIYQMQVDILIREKSRGAVYSTNATAHKQASVNDSKKVGFINSFGGPVRDTTTTAHLNSNITNVNEQNYESNFIEHKTMILAEATKMDLTLEEAALILEKQISNQISGLF